MPTVNPRNKGGGATTARRLAAADRQAAALRLRGRGLSYDAIAKELGYAHHSGAREAVMTGLQAITREPAEALLALETDRLDQLLGRWLPVALDPGQDAVRATELVLKIQERRARLMGLDAPGRQAVAVLAEVETTPGAVNGEDMAEKLSALAERLAAAVHGTAAAEE